MAKAIPQSLHARWFEFEDFNGHGYCQTDVLILEPSCVFILECKLTEVDKGRDQLNLLYMPVLERVYSRPAFGMVVARHLSKETNLRLIRVDLASALRSSREGVLPTLHWLGKGPI